MYVPVLPIHIAVFRCLNSLKENIMGTYYHVYECNTVSLLGQSTRNKQALIIIYKYRFSWI